MGKVEKIAVLSVLFLIAVILVVSLTTDKPVDKSNAAVLGEKPTTPAVATNDPAAAPGTALSSLVKKDEPVAPVTPPAVVPQPLAIPAGSLIKTTDGLSAGFDANRFLYTWQAGDSYVTLAKKYYGEPAKFTLLQNANEGNNDVQPGTKILVPIFDADSSTLVADEPAAKKDGKKKSAADAPKNTTVSTDGKLHTVKKGESLWKIAKAELNDGNRWKEIYDLNKDKLKTPEALRDGMKLRLP